MRKYLIIIEKTATGYSVYSPDINGVVATGKTKSQAEQRMAEAIEFHLEGIKEEGVRPPIAHSYSTHLEFAI
jgi:predicted RNase H-like HicB family nuclease